MQCSFSASFQIISGLGPAFVALGWIKLAHISTERTSLNNVVGLNKSAIFFQIGNRFQVTLGVLISEICKQCLQKKSLNPRARAEKASMLINKINKSKQRLWQAKLWKTMWTSIIEQRNRQTLKEAHLYHSKLSVSRMHEQDWRSEIGSLSLGAGFFNHMF